MFGPLWRNWGHEAVYIGMVSVAYGAYSMYNGAMNKLDDISLIDNTAVIRPMESDDLDAVLTLWLQGNKQAHHFISESYWHSMFPLVSQMMPQAQVWVIERPDDQVHDAKNGVTASPNIILGFLGMNGSHIEGLFIGESVRSQGLGTQLLNFVKKRHRELTLNVYEKNIRAQAFYLREGFVVVDHALDENTGEPDILMRWKA